MTVRRPVTALATAVGLVGAVLVAVGVARQEPAPPQVPSAASASDSASAAGSATGPATHRPDATGAPAPRASAASPAAGASGPSRNAPAALPASHPVHLSIPAIGVSSSLETLHRGTGGAMQTPGNPDRAGWYEPGPAPGSEGPAVIAGHLTWNGHRSVFFDLAKLTAGDTIKVARKDGRTAVFTVGRVEQYPKNRFPTIEVYRNLDHPGLRLITCGGDYSAATHHYADNVVVYAAMTSSHR